MAIEDKDTDLSIEKVEHEQVDPASEAIDEKTLLLAEPGGSGLSAKAESKYNKARLAFKRLVAAFTESLRWILSTLASPGGHVVALFLDEKGNFSPLLPIRKLGRRRPGKNGKSSTAQAIGLSGSLDPVDQVLCPSPDAKPARRKPHSKESKRKPQLATSVLAVTSESETDPAEETVLLDTPASSCPRVHSTSSSEEVPQTRRSIRIKLYNEDPSRRRRQRKGKTDASRDSHIADYGQTPALTVATIKSPTSPASSLRMTRYPRAPAPPRPLIPRRQPSYSSTVPTQPSRLGQKTLVIDLDETLIHSLAKGGRMSSGHMVEVKLNTAVGYGGQTLGPQHPILYYVHKRPYCDDFLKRVCRWYNLVVFTASVQEYADPVIDWLEQERKYFSGRYYRQHCTFRNGAYIKDLSSVEPDLSKVMILDNSPLSYIFHEGRTASA